MNCPICFDEKILCKIECHHKMCFRCLVDWSMYSPEFTCPLCRRRSSFFENHDNFIRMILLRVKDMSKIRTEIPISKFLNFVETYILNERYRNVWRRLQEFRMELKYICLDAITRIDIILMTEKEYMIYTRLIDL